MLFALFALLVYAFSRSARGLSESLPRRLSVALFVVLSSLSWGAVLHAADATGWSSELELALRGAAEREQLVLLYLSSDRCKYCTQMVETTLAEPELRRAIEDYFVPVAVNGNARPDLVRRLKVRAFPTTVVLDARGRVVKQVVGFQTGPKLWQQVGPHARLARGSGGSGAAAEAAMATQEPAPMVNAADLRAAEAAGDGLDGDRLPR